jgi:hypothetical protein
LADAGNVIRNDLVFDTLRIQPSLGTDEVKARAEAKKINLRYFPDGDVSVLIEIFQFNLSTLNSNFRSVCLWTKQSVNPI